MIFSFGLVAVLVMVVSPSSSITCESEHTDADSDAAHDAVNGPHSDALANLATHFIYTSAESCTFIEE